MKLIDLNGKKFGKLTVLRRAPNKPGQDGGSFWECQCDCGNLCSRQASNLKTARTPSCGCARSAVATEVANRPSTKALKAKAITKHGEKTRAGATIEYNTWLRMKSRCYRKTDADYPNWGGRGITVCDSWRNSFAQFLQDMGRRPANKESIDRIDPYSNYEPGNCRWATMHEQVTENLRRAIPVTVDGKEFPTMSAACRHLGLNPATLNERLRAGIPMAVALIGGRLKPRRSRESYLPKDHPDRK